MSDLKADTRHPDRAKMSPQRDPRGSLVRWIAKRAGLPLLVIAIAETALRVVGLGIPTPTSDPSKGFLPFSKVFSESVDKDGTTYLNVVKSPTALMQRLLFNLQRFPKSKADQEYRILCTGGSITYGWPYDDRVSFPRLLEVGLKAAAPQINWRVLNLGAPGWGTVRLKTVADELSRLDADLVIFTSGSNERMEMILRRKILKGLGLRVRLHTFVCRYSRLVSWLTDVASTLRAPLLPEGESKGLSPLDKSDRDLLLAAYERNLLYLTRVFERSGAAVFLTTLPANLKDCPPFVYDAPGDPHGSTDSILAARFSEAFFMLQQGRAAQSVSVLEEIRRAAPDSARVEYAYARALEAAGRKAEARTAYQAALDKDSMALRAFSGINRVIRETAQAPGVTLVDFEKVIADAGYGSAPGDDLFVDHCHPNSQGTWLMTGALAEAMAARGILDLPQGWEGRFHRAIRNYLETVDIPLEQEISAQMYLLWYFREYTPRPDKAQMAQTRIEELDPDAKYADHQFRKRYFAAR